MIISKIIPSSQKLFQVFKKEAYEDHRSTMNPFYIYFLMEYNINQHIKDKGWKIICLLKHEV